MIDTLKMDNVSEDHQMLCPECKQVRLTIDFLDGVCSVCQNAVIEAIKAEQKHRADEQREHKILKAAITNLIKNHRSELDHLISEERFKHALLTRDRSNAKR